MPKTYSNLSKKGLQDLASKMGRSLIKKSAVIGLSGQLGAGKTTFAKSFAKALGLKHITSPTFIVVNSHNLKNRKHFYHIDLYRLNSKNELQTLGLDELFKEQDRIILIEWVEKFPTIKKQCDYLIKISLSPLKNCRNVTIYD